MTMFECPNCRKRITVGFDCNDYVHNCSETVDAPKSVTEEDIVVTGDWKDYTGSGGIPSQMVLMQGAHNELQGTRAGIERYDKEDVTRRGKRASTHRQRAHLEFINIKSEGLN